MFFSVRVWHAEHHATYFFIIIINYNLRANNL